MASLNVVVNSRVVNLWETPLHILVASGAIIGDGDRNEVPNCTILTEQQTRVTRKFAFGFGQTRRSTAFSNACIVEKQTKNDL